MIELENPQIEPVEEVGTYAKYEAGPLQAGYGVTLGNALRRVLLSSLEGAAVTSIQIRDVYQEFSTIPGVKEDVTQIVLNVKKLRLKSFATHPVQLRLIKSGAGQVTAADIAESAEILVNQFRPFVTIGMAAAVGEQVATGLAQLPPNMLDMPIEELDLPMRAYNSLKRNNIVKVGQLLQLKDDDLLRMRNFGKKSLDEMKERLRMRGFMVPETESDGLDDVDDADVDDDDEPFEDEAEG